MNTDQQTSIPSHIADGDVKTWICLFVLFDSHPCLFVFIRGSLQSGGKMLKLSTTARKRVRGSPSMRTTVRVAYSAVT